MTNAVDHLADAELVASARGASANASHAFGELVRRYQRMVYAVAVSLVPASDTDDVVQDAFLRAFRNLDLLADPAKFGIWLRRIAFGVSVDHIRAASRRRVVSLDSMASHVDATTEEELPDLVAIDASALERLERKELADRILAALDRLPARYRVPLTLYHIDGLSHAKVARTLGVPDATVRSLVARARRKLMRALAHTPEVRDMADASRSMRDALDVLDEEVAPSPRFLHVLNGDSVRGTIEQSNVPGAFAPYADILHEGPVSRDTGTDAWRETRAQYIASAGYMPYVEALRTAERWDAQLAAFGDYDEVVLWFEHDLFDQLLLIRHLDWFSRRDIGRTALSLICIGEFPGFEPFHGLGQLDAEQLASLLGTRERVSAEQLALGRRAWEAFTASDPSALVEIARASWPSLQFLPGALYRFLEEYPATGTGLPRTERHILELVSREPMSTHRLFRDEQACEERVFMGDWTFWYRMRGLASGSVPLLTLDGDVPEGAEMPQVTARITDAGREVLAGREDWIRLNGFARWLGGVHLAAPLGGDVEWRWNGQTRSLVRIGANWGQSPGSESGV